MTRRKITILAIAVFVFLVQLACEGSGTDTPPDVYIQTAEAQKESWHNNVATLNAYTPMPGRNAVGETPTPGAVDANYTMGMEGK